MFLQKWKPNLDVVKVNACAKFDQILSILSQDNEGKLNLHDNMGHNCVADLRKWTSNPT